jgi:hypothetical protein
LYKDKIYDEIIVFYWVFQAHTRPGKDFPANIWLGFCRQSQYGFLKEILSQKMQTAKHTHESKFPES